MVDIPRRTAGHLRVLSAKVRHRNEDVQRQSELPAERTPRCDVEQNRSMTTTLSFDCGGGGIKASVLDAKGATLANPLRIPTPYPLPPTRFIETLEDVAKQLPAADRVTVGMPGMIRHGVVVATPHYVTSSGPRSRVDPLLYAAWSGYDAQTAIAE